MSREHKLRAADLWHSLLGRGMTLRLARLLVPKAIWNQEIYGCLLDRYVTRATRWLDGGCGHQLLPSGLEKIERALTAKPRLMVGVDLNLGALRGHQSLHLVIRSSLDVLPLPAESFDLVTCNMVVEHLANPRATFRELARVLCPNGLLVVHTPNVFNYAVCLARILKTLLPRRVVVTLIRWSDSRSAEDVFPTFYRANTRWRLRRFLAEVGLSEEACHMLVGAQPACSFFAPIGLVELLIMHALAFSPLRRFATTILCVYRKSCIAESFGARTRALHGAQRLAATIERRQSPSSREIQEANIKENVNGKEETATTVSTGC